MVFQGQDAWRRHPFFQGLWKSPFPGFQKAAAIYAVYMTVEYAYKVGHYNIIILLCIVAGLIARVAEIV